MTQMQENRYVGTTRWLNLDRLYHAPFEFKAATALGISVAADVLDYAGAPIFALPVIGDIADVFVSGLLYSITRSKKAAAINAIEFIPVIGDFIPAYTISTLTWIREELSRRKNEQKRVNTEISIRANPKITFGKNHDDGTITAFAGSNGKTSDYEDFNDSGGNGSRDLQEEERMRRLVTYRYDRWKTDNR